MIEENELMSEQEVDDLMGEVNEHEALEPERVACPVCFKEWGEEELVKPRKGIGPLRCPYCGNEVA